ncbi:MAG: winged helix DNA-binding domain-containing protein [Candidatus Aminicenantes bacterium]|nr:winged helix DNA-binding domain-containing protein [Candidatus Aminicenantes bacterium]
MINSISKKTARRMVLHAQLLDGKTRIRKGRAGVAQAVGHLGYVQIDTIAVIERAHHHTLWTRVPGYRPEHLHQAHAVNRSLFEYWGHAASYLPMADYRFYLPMMRSFLDPQNAWYRGWGEKYGSYLEPVMKRIREEGAKAARDFENPGGRRTGPWWDWKPAKAALELLFWRGELMVRERQGFQRLYDLTERVLPTGTDVRMPAPDELGRFIVRRALGALGLANEKEIRDYIRIGDKEIIAGAIREMLESAEIVCLTVKGQKGVVYALPKVLEAVSRLRAVPSRPATTGPSRPATTGAPRVRLLNPFDNLVISRSRLKERFAFDYTLECYVPKEKRRHGYFVLPILFGENIVGRLDPKADRRNRSFIVRHLAIEPGFAGAEGLLPELGRALGELARFNGCEKIILENVQPKKLSGPLKKALALGMSG